MIEEAAGMSQMELGEKAGLDHTYIGGIERGERNLSLAAIEKIAFGLKVEIPDLFQFTQVQDKAVLGELMELLALLENRDPETIQRAIEFVKGMLQWVDGMKKS